MKKAEKNYGLNKFVMGMMMMMMMTMMMVMMMMLMIMMMMMMMMMMTNGTADFNMVLNIKNQKYFKKIILHCN